jgi:hypothetical protein
MADNSGYVAALVITSGSSVKPALRSRSTSLGTVSLTWSISPLLSNLYLNEVDQMLERAKAVTRRERWTAVEYARFADDLVILVDSQPPQQWFRQAMEKRLREELAKLQVEANEANGCTVNLQRGESFGFLGFEFRRSRSRRGRWMALLLPKHKRSGRQLSPRAPRTHHGLSKETPEGRSKIDQESR